jgi:hypothetical protein
MKTYVDPNKNAITLLGFPLIFLIVIALIIPKRTNLTLEDMQDRDSLLSALFYALPIPRNWIQHWLVNKLADWIYRERSSLFVLHQIGVNEIGVLPK